MKFTMLLCLFLIGCSSIGKQSSFNKGQCFVKWSSEEYKNRYIKGKNLSRDEKSSNDLLFPVWQNQGIYIVEKVGNDLIVAFDPSDKTPFAIIEKMKKDIFFELSPQTESDLRTSKFKFSQDQLKKIIQGYEEVACTAYMDAQFL